MTDNKRAERIAELTKPLRVKPGSQVDPAWDFDGAMPGDCPRGGISRSSTGRTTRKAKADAEATATA